MYNLLKRLVKKFWEFLCWPWSKMFHYLDKGMPYFKEGFYASYKLFKYAFILIVPPTLIAVSLSIHFHLNKQVNSEDVFSHLSKYTVPLYVQFTFSGTGFYVEAPSGKTYIMTNAHICDNTNTGQLHLTGYNRPVARNIIEIYPFHDLCILEGLPNKKGLKLASDIKNLEKIFTAGYPRIPSLNFSEGHLRSEEVRNLKDAATNTAKTYRLLITSLFSYPGSSGSPIVNSKGELVGVMAGYDQKTNQGIGVPLEEVKKLLAPY
jgi:S1-C subfamily serine protease